jgi:energy-coupling factor transport system substrate-specific component
VLLVWGLQTIAQGALPLHFDMIGVAFTSMLFGPGWGLLVAAITAATHPLTLEIWGPTGFALIPGALLWGFGIRRWGFGRTLGRFLLLSFAVGLATSLVVVPILFYYHGGEMMHANNQYALNSLSVLGGHPVISMYIVNLFSNLVDKLATGVIALLLIHSLFRKYASRDLRRLVSPHADAEG